MAGCEPPDGPDELAGTGAPPSGAVPGRQQARRGKCEDGWARTREVKLTLFFAPGHVGQGRLPGRLPYPGFRARPLLMNQAAWASALSAAASRPGCSDEVVPHARPPGVGHVHPGGRGAGREQFGVRGEQLVRSRPGSAAAAARSARRATARPDGSAQADGSAYARAQASSHSGLSSTSRRTRSGTARRSRPRSSQGDSRMQPAGSGWPSSRRDRIRDRASPPPAESPDTTTEPGSVSPDSALMTARASSTAAGWGCSGARRYSGSTTRQPAWALRCAAHDRGVSAEPTQ